MSRVVPSLQKSLPETAEATTSPKPHVHFISPGNVTESRTAEDETGSRALDTLERPTLSLSVPECSRRIAFTAPSSEAAEQYRILRTKILHSPRRPQFVLISSPTAKDGKTTTALNLAWALAVGSQENVLLLEADLRRPGFHEQVPGIPRSPGLAELAAGEGSLSEVLVRLEHSDAGRFASNLYVIPAGRAVVNAAELLSSRQWTELCGLFRTYFQFIIADSPPVAAVADYELIEAVSDGVVLVARPDHTKRKLLLDALEKTSKSKMLGILLNSVPKWFLWKYHYHDFYRASADGRA